MEVISNIKNEAGVDIATIDAEANVLGDLKRANPWLTIFTPSSQFFSQVRQIQCLYVTDVPLAILWPRSESDVSKIVKYAVARQIPFCVRSGGHDLYGRSMQDGMLVIDMRCMDKVEVAADKKSVVVQGGACSGDMSQILSEKELFTTIGSSNSVSYAGFAISGGYGPVSGLYGMGSDNIIGARLVDSQGDIVEANEDLLYAIRGAGGAFGVITELKVKTYSLLTLLAGMILFKSDNLEEQIPSFLKSCQELLTDDIPAFCGIYLGIINRPGAGCLFGAVLTWASQDHEAGQEYFNKIRALGTVVFDTVTSMKPVGFMTLLGGVTSWRTYGAVRSFYVETLSDKFIEVFTRSALKMPSDPGMCMVIQLIHGKATQLNPDSCFPRQKTHYLVELISNTGDEVQAPACLAWANEGYEDLLAAGVRSPGGYIAITPPGSVSVQEIYGSSYEKLLELKKIYDPHNVFKNTYPQFDY